MRVGETGGECAWVATPDVGQETTLPAPNSMGPSARRSMGIGVALTAPAIAALAVTMLYPIGWTIWLTFNRPKAALRGRPDFVGLHNYAKILLNREFRSALVQTLGLTAASFVAEAAIGLPVALRLNRGLAGTRFFQAVVSLPLMGAPVVGALAWRFMFAAGYGLIDSVLHLSADPAHCGFPTCGLRARRW